ncbi:FG-GAP-like repeat-containing protein [Streptomyces sviceus]|uniref:FG-GAP-like repeat-containing protein n=1 Tax=Streptomyces sviceus TaxID=285530 RepID=UPI0036B0A6A0
MVNRTRDRHRHAKGDITGDGKADLISRDSAVWRNNGDGKGSFGTRTKIASGWQGYKGLF